MPTVFVALLPLKCIASAGTQPHSSTYINRLIECNQSLKPAKWHSLTSTCSQCMHLWLHLHHGCPWGCCVPEFHQTQKIQQCHTQRTQSQQYHHLTPPVMVQLVHMPENHRDMHRNLIMGSGRLPEGRSESRSPRMCYKWTLRRAFKSQGPRGLQRRE